MMTRVLLAAFSAALLLAPPAPAAGPTAGTGTTARQIVVTYFHGDVRCASCRRLEAFTREAVDRGLEAEVAAGRVIYRTVNTDRPESAHFVREYALVSRAVVIADEHGGTVARWSNLDRVWRLLRNQEAFTSYVVENVRSYLAEKP
jgi:hypothetical protein